MFTVVGSYMHFCPINYSLGVAILSIYFNLFYDSEFQKNKG